MVSHMGEQQLEVVHIMWFQWTHQCVFQAMAMGIWVLGYLHICEYVHYHFRGSFIVMLLSSAITSCSKIPFLDTMQGVGQQICSRLEVFNINIYFEHQGYVLDFSGALPTSPGPCHWILFKSRYVTTKWYVTTWQPKPITSFLKGRYNGSV